jgi:hypothetical protein
MSTQLPTQADVPHVELNDGPHTENELIRLAWFDLFGCMKDICDTLNGGGCLGWFYLPQGARLFYEKPSRTEQKIVYRVAGREYVMWLDIDLDLGHVLYRFDPCLFTFQRVISTRGQQAYFCNRDLAPYGEDTMEEAAKSLMFEFLLLDSDSGRLAAGTAESK